MEDDRKPAKQNGGVGTAAPPDKDKTAPAGDGSPAPRASGDQGPAAQSAPPEKRVQTSLHDLLIVQ